MNTKHTILLLVTLILCGCDRIDYASIVTQKYPDAEVYPLPQHDDQFLIRKDDGSVWQIRSAHSKFDVQEVQVFPARGE